jgi:CheY-like chemotaxis protein
MSKLKNIDIVVVMFQYSVIIKSIERKLTELECRFTTVSEGLEYNFEREGKYANLILFYLPPDINDEAAKPGLVRKLCRTVLERGQKAVLIGESKYQADFLAEIPKLKKYPWINRPIDMKALEDALVQEMEREEIPERKKRILIVDDDPSYAKMIREWIKTDYRVDIVTAGMQAITFLLKVPEDDRIDMILLDYEMPVVDGPQVLQMLRQESATADIPVVFLTGNGTREAVSRVMALKPEGYILKSTSKADLMDFLEKKFYK